MQRKNPTKPVPAVAKAEKDPFAHYRLVLWLVFGVNALFFWWQCVDRYLAPRFLFLSLSLLLGVGLLWRDLTQKADWRLHRFDLLLLAWYGWNVASIGWAFSWSEAVFYTQKVFLLFAVYWLVRQMLLRDEPMVRKVLFRATVMLTWVVCGLLLVQLAIAFSKNGLVNEALYDYASGVYGNKSLASEFLFFLLIFNGLYRNEFSGKTVFYGNIALLLLLIVLLQTRTAYLAIVAGALVYFPIRAWLEPAFRPVFLKKILPVAVAGMLILAGLLAAKGRGSSLAERLNPATYLESVSANERRFVWYKTDLLNSEHFWAGVGNGSWKFWFPSKNIEGGYRLQEQNVIFTRAHNDYLEIRSELGIVGVVLFCGIFATAFFGLFGHLKKNTDTNARHHALWILLGLMGYCIIQYLDFPRERIEMQVLLAVLLAYAVYYAGEIWNRTGGIDLAASSKTFLGVLALGLALNVWIGWSRVTGEIHTIKAAEAQSRKDYRTAIREAQSARNLFNEYNDVAIPLQWYEGIAAYFMGDAAGSVAAFEEAYRLNPWSFQVMNNYASALIQSGQAAKAITILENAVSINPRYDEGKLNLSYAYMELQNYPKATEWLERVDTVRNPTTDDARRKNAEIKRQQAIFRKELENRMQQTKK